MCHPPGCCSRRADSSAGSCACCSVLALCSGACGRSPRGPKGSRSPPSWAPAPAPQALLCRTPTLPPSCRPRHASHAARGETEGQSRRAERREPGWERARSAGTTLSAGTSSAELRLSGTQRKEGRESLACLPPFSPPSRPLQVHRYTSALKPPTVIRGIESHCTLVKLPQLLLFSGVKSKRHTSRDRRAHSLLKDWP